jgi:dTDP-4-amino-4,6-dideoxygalactose transaminase
VKIPLLDLQAQLESIRDTAIPALLSVVESQHFIMGEAVGKLESEVARLSHARFGIACASGTDALLLSLKTLDLEPGDEVITSTFTFFATAGAIHNAGGRPVFVDIDPDTFNLDMEQVAASITSRTRAIVPIHLFGQMALMEPILRLAAQHGFAIIEDAAQAIGARQRVSGTWRVAGELGTTGALSFFPSKNLGAWGDGGMIVTQDPALDSRLRKLRTHGGAKEYDHEEVGFNSRLDTIQAAILLTKISHLAEWNAARRSRAACYTAGLGKIAGVKAPSVDPLNEHAFHQYTIRAERRDELQAHLKTREIGSKVYYPKPLHQQSCFNYLRYAPGRFPEAERASREVLSLPVYPELSDAACQQVIDAIAEFYQ